MRLWAAALALTCFIAGPSRAEDLVTPSATQTYGTQVLSARGAFIAPKPTGEYDKFAFTVGAQINGWSEGGRGIVWGIATEAVALPGSRDWLVGLESLVVNADPNNVSWLTGVHAVIGCRTWEMVVMGRPCLGPNNIQSRAMWITAATPDTGWESAIKLAPDSLLSMPGRPKPTVIDLRDVPDAKLKGWCLIATATRCITVDDLVRPL